MASAMSTWAVRAACVGALGVCGSAMAQVDQRTIVAASGQPAPGITGATFVDVWGPRVTEAGAAGFIGRVTGGGVTTSDDRGVWLDDGAGLALHMRTGTALLGSTTRVLAGFSLLALQEDASFLGGVFDSAAPTPPSRPFAGLFVADPAGLVTRDVESGITLPDAAYIGGGRQVYVTSMGPTGATTMYVNDGAARTLLVSSGRIVATPEGDYTIATLERPSVNASGDVAFRARLVSGTTETTGLFLLASGVLELVAWVDPTPAPGEAGFSAISVSPGISDSGDVVFWARQRGPGITHANDSGVFRWSAGVVTPIALESQAAPGAPGFSFGEIGQQVAVSSFGRIAFRALIVGSSEEPARSGLWAEDEGGLVPIAIERQMFAGLQFSHVGHPLVSRAGQVAFKAVLTGPGVTPDTAEALCATDHVGRLRTLARRGDRVDVSGQGTDVRTVRQIIVEHGSTTTGSGAFTGRGELGYRMVFRDVLTGGQVRLGSAVVVDRVGCRADADGSGVLDILDFLAFGNVMAAGSPRADFEPDGVLDVLDLLRFQNEFALGCP